MFPFVSLELALDLAERAAMPLLFLLFVNRMLPRLVQLVLIQREHPEVILLAVGLNAQALLLVLSEFLGVLLIVIRRRSASLSSHPLDWALSLSAVTAPLLLLTTPAAANAFIPETLVTTLMLMGLLVQISANLAIGRSFGLVPANRAVKTPGLYRVVRHPIYAGYTLTHIGFLLGFPSLQNAALYVGVFTIEVTRLLREEPCSSAIRLMSDTPHAYATGYYPACSDGASHQTPEFVRRLRSEIREGASKGDDRTRRRPGRFRHRQKRAAGPRLPIVYLPDGNPVDYTVFVKGQSFSVRQPDDMSFMTYFYGRCAPPPEGIRSHRHCMRKKRNCTHSRKRSKPGSTSRSKRQI